MKIRDWLWLIFTALALVLSGSVFCFNTFAQKENVNDKFGEVLRRLGSIETKLDKWDCSRHN